MPVRIQRRRAKGWKNVTNAIYVGRPTKWGNPYQCKNFTRSMAVGLFRDLVKKWPKEILEPLRGHDLCCWCPLTDKDGDPVDCHADVLLEFANK